MPEKSPVESLFFAALELPPGDRSTFLDGACGGDTALRARVEKMLAAQPDLGDFLGRPVAPIPDPAVEGAPPGELPGAVIGGKYRLLEQIGEGGMGAVWLADQLHPVQRRVAVKLVRGERAGSRGILARFEAERHAVARMDHPHIARLLDAGATESGLPYFVMELVGGVPLNQYCDAHKLTVPDRLALFVQVCRAVQHAHQKGIIHRDLKPSNILVEHHNGRPVPRVIDFGLAKATGGERLPDETLFTRPGNVAGTPLYMAPEQADVTAADIDTRADVYALGVNLYELLTGTTPIERERLKHVPLFEILHAIRDSDPPTPSKRLSSADVPPAVAASRGTEPAKLGRFVRGDLDWIVMKALAKERDRRYETAAALADDVERFLGHEPVLAGPPGAGYRLRKFVRRNRVQVTAAGLVAAALVVGLVGTSLGLLEARRQRDAADTARRGETDERQKAETQGRRAATVARFLTETLKGAAPGAARGRDTKLLLDMLDSAVAGLDRNALAADPEAETELRSTIGEVYHDLGDYPKAELFLHRAADLAAATFGPDDPRTADADLRLATTLGQLGRHTESLPLAGKVRDGCGRRGEPESHRAVQAWTLIGGARHAIAGGWTADAETAARTAVDIGRRVYQPQDPWLAVSLRQLALLYRARDAHADALLAAREAYGISLKVRGRQNRETIFNACILADCQLDRSDFAAAEKLMRDTLPDAEAVYGTAHRIVADVLWRLGRAVSDRGDPLAAARLHERCLEIRRATYKGPHPDVATALASVARAKIDTGKPEIAEPLLREVVEMRRTLFGRTNPNPAVASALRDWGECLRRLDHLDDAEKQLTESLGMFRTTLPDPANYTGVFFELAMVAQARNNFPRAIDLFGQIVEVYRRQHDPGHIEVARALSNLATARYRSGDKIGAEADLREALAIARKANPNHPTTVLCLGKLRFVLEGRGDWTGAEPLAREGVKIQRDLVGADHPRYAAATADLADNLVNQGKHADAESYWREALAVQEKARPNDWQTFSLQARFGGFLLTMKKYAAAEPLLVRGYEGMKAREQAAPPGGRSRHADAADGLVELYTALGKPDEMRKWRAERAKYPFIAPAPRAVPPRN